MFTFFLATKSYSNLDQDLKMCSPSCICQSHSFLSSKCWIEQLAELSSEGLKFYCVRMLDMRCHHKSIGKQILLKALKQTKKCIHVFFQQQFCSYLGLLCNVRCPVVVVTTFLNCKRLKRKKKWRIFLEQKQLIEETQHQVQSLPVFLSSFNLEISSFFRGWRIIFCQ